MRLEELRLAAGVAAERVRKAGLLTNYAHVFTGASDRPLGITRPCRSAYTERRRGPSPVCGRVSTELQSCVTKPPRKTIPDRVKKDHCDLDDTIVAIATHRSRRQLGWSVLLARGTRHRAPMLRLNMISNPDERRWESSWNQVARVPSPARKLASSRARPWAKTRGHRRTRSIDEVVVSYLPSRTPTRWTTSSRSPLTLAGGPAPLVELALPGGSPG